MCWKEYLNFGTQAKTFLEQINPILRLGNVYSTALYAMSEKSATISILLSVPLQLIFLICCANFSEIINMFKSTTKFIHAVDILCLGLGITSTILRPIYFFVRRNRYKQTVLNLHQINCSLGMQKRQRFVPNLPFVITISLIIFVSSTCIVFLLKFQIIKPTISNIVVFLVIYHSSLVSDITDRTIGEELRNLFEVLNDNIRSCIAYIDDGTTNNIGRVMECTNIHRKLVKLSSDFVHLCSTPVLISLGLNVSLAVWMMHCCIMLIMLQIRNYQYIIVMVFLRVVLSLIYTRFVTDTFDLVENEVSCSGMKPSWMK